MAFQGTLHGTTQHYVGTGGTDPETPAATGFIDSASSWLDGELPDFDLNTVVSFGGRGTQTYSVGQLELATLELNRIILDNQSSATQSLNLDRLHFLENGIGESAEISILGSGSFLLNSRVAYSGSPLYVGGDGTGSVSISGSLIGSGGLTFNSAGTMILTGAGTSVSGATTVARGALHVLNDGLKGNIHVTSGGTLHTAGGASTTREVIVDGGGTWNVGASNSETINRLRIGNSADLGTGESRVNLRRSLVLAGSGSNLLHMEGSAVTPSVLNFGGYGESAAGGIQLSTASPGAGLTTLTFGPHGRIESGIGALTSPNNAIGRISWNGTASASNYLVYQFEGTTINTLGYGNPGGPELYHNRLRIGDTSGQTAGYFTQVLINAGLGDGSGYLQVAKSTITLGWNGDAELGALITAEGGATSGGATNATQNTSNPIVIRNTVTGMFGGQIWGAGNLEAGPGAAGSPTSLVFEEATEPGHTFTLGVSHTARANQVGVIDVTTRNASWGFIDQKNVNLVLDGGALRGVSLRAGSGTIALKNNAQFALSRHDVGSADDFYISTLSAGVNNRTLFLEGENAGQVYLSSNRGNSRIVLNETLAGNAQWRSGWIAGLDQFNIYDVSGITNANNGESGGYYNGFTIGEGSGLIGIRMGHRAPFAHSGSNQTLSTAMTLEAGAGFYGIGTNTARYQFNYYLGTQDQLAEIASEGLTTRYNAGIEVAESGSVLFGTSQSGGTAPLANERFEYLGNGLARVELSTQTAEEIGLKVGGLISLQNVQGTNSAYYTDQYLITAISGNSVEFKLGLTPETSGVPNSNANLRTRQKVVTHLLRDRGDDTVTIIATGSDWGPSISIAGNQTGAGTLWAQSWEVTLEEGVNFSGSLFSGHGSAAAPWRSVQGVGPSGLNVSQQTFVVNGNLGVSAGDAVQVVLQHTTNQHGGILIGASAYLQGEHQWTLSAARATSTLFDNNLTNANRWDANIGLSILGNNGLLEASTRVDTSPASASYKFQTLSLNQGHFGSESSGVIRLVNTVQNGGGSGKEAFYVGNLDISVNDGSGRDSLVRFNLNGQDLWYDEMSPVGQGQVANSRGFVFSNDAMDSVSTLRNTGDGGAPIYGAGFHLLNGATLEVEGARWQALQTNEMGFHSTDGKRLPSDFAAAPNNGILNNNDPNESQRSLRWNGTSGRLTSGISFLGSGTEGPSSQDFTTAKGTDGTLHIVGNDFVSNGYILNPVGVTGTIDTRDREGHYHDVTLRAASVQAIRGTSGDTRILITNDTEAGKALYQEGDIVYLSRGNSSNPHIVSERAYYVVGTGEVGGVPYVEVSQTYGGTPITLSANLSGGNPVIRDFNGSKGTGNSAAYPALIVAGTTHIEGNLNLIAVRDSSATSPQATLRVGGVTSSLTPTAASQTASLHVRGDFLVESGINLAIQSNARLHVGGNVSIAGVGSNLQYNVTGTGVGIHGDSHLTLTGLAATGQPQQVAIAPHLGHFHVGDGAAGLATGNHAQALLRANLHVTSSADINGATSSLDLGGNTLTLAPDLTLVSGGLLTGHGHVEGNVRFISGGQHSLGTSRGVQTISGNLEYQSGSTYTWGLAANSILTGADFLEIGGGLLIGDGAYLNLSLNGLGSTVDFTDAFWGESQLWNIASAGDGIAGGFTLGDISLDSFGQNHLAYGTFAILSNGESLALQWQTQAIPEPSTWALLVLSSGGLLWLRRSRSRV